MSKKLTIDGNTAVSHVSYALSEIAVIYPITPSSPMAENVDEWSNQNRLNVFGQKLKVVEMQSEAGAAGALHGSLTAGALGTTYTSSQGLLLMIPNMYKIAGEMLPCVFHVSARALAAQALNIFGDHSDIYACRQTGFAMLASSSVQETMDLALVAHLATLKSKVPFLHFFDGFRTSHEISKIDAIDYEEIKSIVDMEDIKDFKSRSLNPEHPIQRGTAQNPDIYFQNREANNAYYEATPNIVQATMDKVASVTGRQYHLVDYFGSPKAKKVIVMMGSGADTCEETINYLNAQGEDLGLIKVRLYRPFPTQAFINAIPKSCTHITVLDRTKEPGSIGEPLYQDVITTLAENGISLKVLGGRYGLGSKEFDPSMVNAIYENMDGECKNHFTVGINDDVTNTSLAVTKKIISTPKDALRCKFYGLGSDGTVGANKNSIKIIGNYTDKYVQGYFAYDSKKSGGITISHLRFGDTPIKSSYLINQSDFIACHNQAYIGVYDMISELKENGIFLLNCNWNPADLDSKLPAEVKQTIANKNINFYIIDAIKIAKGLGLGGRINTIMQACFFYLTNVIPYEDAEKYMKEYIYKTFGRKGDKIVNMNYAAVDSAKSGIIKVDYPAEWATATTGAEPKPLPNDKYFKEFIQPILVQKGDTLPVSAFNIDGSVPTDTAKFEKRGTAVVLPKWIQENCIQCNQCAFVCPHACIRPVLQTEDKLTGAPESFTTLKAIGVADYRYRMQLSPLDCVACGSCANVCPAKEKALVMVPTDEIVADEIANWDFFETLPLTDAPIKRDNLKNSQYNKPYFEFSGACAGCGETPYIKLVTQLYGDRMIIANATGCSSIYGGSAPTCPYAKDEKGRGPAWANSLFEDNAEFGLGIQLAYQERRLAIKDNINSLAAQGYTNDLLAGWVDTYNNYDSNLVYCELIKNNINALVEAETDNNKKVLLQNIANNLDCLIKKSIWIIGGDGWAYDIGYGGLDHVLASGADVNVLVLDTELYSNTGGQASKASQIGAVAKFASGGKPIKKKDLGKMAMSYEYVYVAQVSMGANMNQCLNAIKEAESYNGPSLVIAYSPCINHGINMSNTQLEMKRAVETGYVTLYRYNPRLLDEGKNPFVLDSKEPSYDDYQGFLASETRYSSLAKTNPESAKELFKQSEQIAKARYESYKKLSQE